MLTCVYNDIWCHKHENVDNLTLVSHDKKENVNQQRFKLSFPRWDFENKRRKKEMDCYACQTAPEIPRFPH